MRTLLVILFLVAAICQANVQAKISEPSIDKETVRKAILIFRQTPLNQQGSMVRPLILRFARESPAVEIVVSSKAMPWIGSAKLDSDNREALLIAYVAGDVQSQLTKRRTKDDPVAGTEQVIATYRQLQQAQPRLRSAEVEKLIDLQKQGKLANYLTTAR